MRAQLSPPLARPRKVFNSPAKERPSCARASAQKSDNFVARVPRALYARTVQWMVGRRKLRVVPLLFLAALARARRRPRTQQTVRTLAESCNSTRIAPAEPPGQAGIPKVLHQTWSRCELPWPQQLWWSRCARTLSHAWQLFMWDDVMLRDLVARRFPHMLRTYDGYDVNIKRVDAARYMLLYEWGGVYQDLDFGCLRSFEDAPRTDALLRRNRLVLFFDPGNGLHNSWMAAPPRHPFLRFVIDGLALTCNATHPLDATGPRFLARRYVTWKKARNRLLLATRSNTSDDAIQLLRSAELGGVYTLRPRVRPCGDGLDEHRIDQCRWTPEMRNFSAITFWNASWAQGFYAKCAARFNGTHRCHAKNVRGDLLDL